MFKSLAYDAMVFAREAHKDQVRKYTGEPYFNHLAEVVGISQTVLYGAVEQYREKFIAVAWLHDVVKDWDVKTITLRDKFGDDVATGVWYLTDFETGNRKQRKEASRKRLSDAPGWIQTIKCADLISNATSIIKHDPKFAPVFCGEALMLLDVMDKANSRLRDMAYGICRNQ